jgi:hypothetical protein
MTDSKADEDDEEEVEETEAVEASDEDPEEPDITDEDRADGADVFGSPDIDPDADLDDEDDEDENEEQTDSEDDSDENDDGNGLPDDPLPDDVSAGKVYCRGIGVMTALAVSRFDDDDERERDDIVEEYAGLCEQMYLDKYVDAALAERGGFDSLGPGEKALAATGLVAVMICLWEPAISDAALDGIEMPDTSSLSL